MNDDIFLIQGESVRWHRRWWTKYFSMQFCVWAFGTRLRRLFYTGPINRELTAKEWKDIMDGKYE